MKGEAELTEANVKAQQLELEATRLMIDMAKHKADHDTDQDKVVVDILKVACDSNNKDLAAQAQTTKKAASVLGVSDDSKT